MIAPRAIGRTGVPDRLPVILSVLLALAMVSRCASSGAKDVPAGTPVASDASAPETDAATDTSVAPETADPTEAVAAPPAIPAATPAAAPALPVRVDFTAHILPLLQQKCSPCHFPGGRMHDRLPFDQEATIRVLGKQMFSRLREPLDQELIRTYLEQP